MFCPFTKENCSKSCYLYISVFEDNTTPPCAFRILALSSKMLEDKMISDHFKNIDNPLPPKL
jgi:hypothetical protein